MLHVHKKITRLLVLKLRTMNWLMFLKKLIFHGTTVPKCTACLCGEGDAREGGSGVCVEAVRVCVGAACVWESGTCVCERAVHVRAHTQTRTARICCYISKSESHLLMCFDW